MTCRQELRNAGFLHSHRFRGRPITPRMTCNDEASKHTIGKSARIFPIMDIEQACLLLIVSLADLRRSWTCNHKVRISDAVVQHGAASIMVSLAEGFPAHPTQNVRGYSCHTTALVYDTPFPIVLALAWLIRYATRSPHLSKPRVRPA